MLKKHMAACLMATAVMTAPALSQTSPTPAPTQPSTPAPTASSGGSSGQFMTMPQPGQWRASKLVGVDIYGSDNAKIGDVNEVILDSSGNAQAVVIGVGGFLGIGEKDVAIPFKSVEWKNEPRATATAGTGTAPGTAGAPATTGTTATTGSTGTAGTAGTRSASDANRGYPDHGMVRMSKADLQNAPAFNYDRESASRSSAPATGTGATAPAGGTAPRQ